MTAYFLLVAFALHLISGLRLIIALKKHRDTQILVDHDKAFLDQEICKLTIILIIFNSTYLIRALYDFFAEPEGTTTVKILVSGMILGATWDFLPVMLLMTYHYRNFRLKKDSNQRPEEELDFGSSVMDDSVEE